MLIVVGEYTWTCAACNCVMWVKKVNETYSFVLDNQRIIFPSFIIYIVINTFLLIYLCVSFGQIYSYFGTGGKYVIKALPFEEEISQKKKKILTLQVNIWLRLQTSSNNYANILLCACVCQESICWRKELSEKDFKYIFSDTNWSDFLKITKEGTF